MDWESAALREHGVNLQPQQQQQQAFLDGYVKGKIMEYLERIPTKREYFAGLAMYGFPNDNPLITPHLKAKYAVELADALLKALDNQGE